MKRIIQYIVYCISCTIVLGACSLPSKTKDATQLSEVPQATQSITPPIVYDGDNWWREEKKASQYSWGYDVFTPDSEMGIYREEGQLVRSTVYEGGVLKLGIRMSLFREETDPITCGMMVLVDGRPTSFIPDEEEEAVYMNPFSVVKDTVQVFTLSPEFTSKDGRVDIILITELMNANGSCAVLPVYVENQSEVYAEELNTVTTTPYPNNFQAIPKKDYSIADWWLWSADADEVLRAGRSVIQMINLSTQGEEWLFECDTGLTGELRTTFFLDYQPYSVWNEKSYVDWKKVDGEMLSLPFSIPKIEYPSMLMAITIRQDDTNMEYQSMVFKRVMVKP